jgi:hypothetical protein
MGRVCMANEQARGNPRFAVLFDSTFIQAKSPLSTWLIAVAMLILADLD